MTSYTTRILFAGLANWVSRGVGILLSLILMPVLFRHMPRQELGVWLLLGQSWAALGVFDLGFGTILTRRIAFAVGQMNGQTNDLRVKEQLLQQVSNLMTTGARVYRLLAFVSFSASFLLGLFYLRSLDLQGLSQTTVLLAWGILCLGQALGIWATVWTCFLQGVGYVGWDSFLVSLANSLTVLVEIVMVLLGGGLMGLAVAAATGTLLQRLLIIRFMRRRRADMFAIRGVWKPELLREMLRPALLAWLTSLGYLLLANTDQLFIASTRGAAAIPAYRAAFLLVVNLHVLAGVFSAASPVFVSQLWQAGDLLQIRAILRRNSQIGLLAMCCGSGAFVALGPTLFDVWLGPGNFIGHPVLIIFLVTLMLEHHANVFSSCARATDDEAYALSSIAGGVLKLLLALWLTWRLGLLGLALATLIAQAVTNDWFMVYRSLRRLGVDFGQHAREVIGPCIAAFAASLGLGLCIDLLLHDFSKVTRLATVTGTTGTLLVIAMWRVVLNEPQRHRMLRRLGFA